MYTWIFRSLPGPFIVRLILFLALIAAVLAVLIFWVFPWLDQYVTIFSGNVTVDDGSGQ